MTTQQIHETHIKIAFFAVLVIMLAAIYVAIPDFYRTVWQLSTSGNMQGTIDYLRSFGAWAVLVSMIIDIVINIVGFLPSIFISTANGVLFGVIISFFFMRTLFRHKAKKVIEKSRMLSKLDHYSTWQAMTLARAVPYSPNGLVTALGALSRISYRDYILGCFIGKLPSVAGHDLVMMEEHSMRLTIVLIVIAIVYGGLWYWHRRQQAKKVLHKIADDLKDGEGRS